MGIDRVVARISRARASGGRRGIVDAGHVHADGVAGVFDVGRWGESGGVGLSAIQVVGGCRESAERAVRRGHITGQGKAGHGLIKSEGHQRGLTCDQRVVGHRHGGGGHVGA